MNALGRLGAREARQVATRCPNLNHRPVTVQRYVELRSTRPPPQDPPCRRAVAGLRSPWTCPTVHPAQRTGRTLAPSYTHMPPAPRSSLTFALGVAVGLALGLALGFAVASRMFERDARPVAEVPDAALSSTGAGALAGTPVVEPPTVALAPAGSSNARRSAEPRPADTSRADTPSDDTSRARDRVVVPGAPTRQVTFDVRLPDGTRLEVASIELERRSEGRRRGRSTTAWHRDTPTIEFPYPAAFARALAGELPELGDSRFTRFVSEPVEVTGDEAEPVTLTLAERTRLRVELVDSDGTPDPDGGHGGQRPWLEVVEAHRFDPERPFVSLDLGRMTGFDGKLARLDGGGVFFDLAPGDWVVVAGRPPVQPRATVEAFTRVTVGPGETRCRLELPRIDPSRYLAVTCIGPDGALLKQMEFTVGLRTSGGSSTVGLGGGSPMDDGVFRFSLAQLRAQRTSSTDSEPVITELHAQHRELGNVSVVVPPGTTELVLRFAAPGSLHVELSGFSHGHFVVRADTADEHLAHGRYGHETVPVDARGRATLTALAPGDYDVRVLGPVGASAPSVRMIVSSAAITVRSGDNHLSLVVPTLHEVRVESTQLARGAEVRLRQLGADLGFRLDAEVDAQGFAVFGGVPAGEFELSADGDVAPDRITVPPTSHTLRARASTEPDGAVRARQPRQGGAR